MALVRLKGVGLSPYELKRVDQRGVVSGTLLRCEFSSEDQKASSLVGYSCLQTWPSLGEPRWEGLIPLLKLGEEAHRQSLLLQRCLEMAAEDAQARGQGRALLGETVELPSSHALIWWPEPGEKSSQLSADWLRQKVTYDFFKLKISAQQVQTEPGALKNFVESLGPEHRLRLDFNSSFRSSGEFLTWWRGVEDWLRPFVDFMEDPVDSGSLQEWQELEQAAPVAADRQSEPEVLQAASIRIWKPLVHREPQSPRVVTTTNLDHPLGQAYAAFKSIKRPPETCGLQTAHVYERDAFSESISYDGPRMRFCSEGLGFGFTPQLESLDWISLD